MTSAPFNPPATFPCNPAQGEFFTFLTPHGFGALRMHFIIGFDTDEENPEQSRVYLHDCYHASIEPVPVLIARFVAIQQIDRPAASNIDPPVTGVPASARPPAGSIWKTPAG